MEMMNSTKSHYNICNCLVNVQTCCTVPVNSNGQQYDPQMCDCGRHSLHAIIIHRIMHALHAMVHVNTTLRTGAKMILYWLDFYYNRAKGRGLRACADFREFANCKGMPRRADSSGGLYVWCPTPFYFYS